MNNDNQPCSAGDSTFSYTDEKFADLQMLRYRVDGFARLTVRQKGLLPDRGGSVGTRHPL